MRSRSRCRWPPRGPRAGDALARRSRDLVGGAILDRLGRALSPRAHGGSRRPAQEPALVRLARVAARRVDALDARPRLQRRAQRAGRGASRNARARHRRRDRDHGRSASRLPDAAARAAGVAGLARDRYAEARILRRARLVRHPHFRTHRRARVVRMGLVILGGMPAPVAQLFRDTEAGYQPPLRCSRSACRRSSRCCGWRSCARQGGRTDALCSTGPRG